MPRPDRTTQGAAAKTAAAPSFPRKRQSAFAGPARPKAFPVGGCEGPENCPVDSFHRTRGRQAPKAFPVGGCKRPKNRPVACSYRTTGRQAPAVNRAAGRMRFPLWVRSTRKCSPDELPHGQTRPLSSPRKTRTEHQKRHPIRMPQGGAYGFHSLYLIYAALRST